MKGSTLVWLFCSTPVPGTILVFSGIAGSQPLTLATLVVLPPIVFMIGAVCGMSVATAPERYTTANLLTLRLLAEQAKAVARQERCNFFFIWTPQYQQQLTGHWCNYGQPGVEGYVLEPVASTSAATDPVIVAMNAVATWQNAALLARRTHQ